MSSPPVMMGFLKLLSGVMILFLTRFPRERTVRKSVFDLFCTALDAPGARAYRLIFPQYGPHVWEITNITVSIHHLQLLITHCDDWLFGDKHIAIEVTIW